MKALALFSGGLDSMLAMKLMNEQGVEVTALYMDTGFGVDEEKHAEAQSSRYEERISARRTF